MLTLWETAYTFVKGYVAGIQKLIMAQIQQLVLCTKRQTYYAYFFVKTDKKLKEAPEGIEPSTSSLLDWRSNQLSYGAVDILLWKHQNDTQSLSTNDNETGLGIGRSKRFLSACYMYMYTSHRQKIIIFLGLWKCHNW